MLPDKPCLGQVGGTDTRTAMPAAGLAARPKGAWHTFLRLVGVIGAGHLCGFGVDGLAFVPGMLPIRERALYVQPASVLQLSGWRGVRKPTSCLCIQSALQRGLRCPRQRIVTVVPHAMRRPMQTRWQGMLRCVAGPAGCCACSNSASRTE